MQKRPIKPQKYVDTPVLVLFTYLIYLAKAKI